MLILTVISNETSALEVTSLDFHCLTRDQKEKIEICFEQADACQKEIDKITKPGPAPTWVLALMTGVLGAVGGFMIRGAVK